MNGICTGLRYSDFTRLTQDNLKVIDGKEIFQLVAKKTKARLDVPCHPVVKRILDQNDGRPPKAISNQKMNDYLKDIGQLMELNDLVTKRIDPGGQVKVLEIPKWKLLSSHTARRSYATNAYKAGLDSLSIMKITGHTQHSTFMKYIRVTGEENAVRMADHKFYAEEL
jgi:integrase